MFNEKENGTWCSVSIHETKDAQLLNSVVFSEFDPVQFGAAVLSSKLQKEQMEDGSVDYRAEICVTQGKTQESCVSMDFEFDNWSKDNYVFAPAAIYNGNRFRCMPLPYAPLIEDKSQMGVDFPITITNVPRLSLDGEKSDFQLTTADLATPLVGFFCPKEKKGVFLLTKQNNQYGNFSVSVEETEQFQKAKISFRSPSLRIEKQYIPNNMIPSKDKGICLSAGDQIEIAVKYYSFDCESILEFYEKFVQIRKSVVNNSEVVNIFPFSAAFAMEENFFNESRWNDIGKYYPCFDAQFYDYQIGWVGGMQSSNALLINGCELSRNRAVESINRVLTETQAPSGFMYGSGKDKHLISDGFWSIWPHNMHAIRKSGDGLYFLMKQILFLERHDPSWKTPPEWKTAVARLADAFVNLWKRYGQYGQIVDIETGELLIGGSSAGAIVPAGLALAGVYFDNAEYTEVAERSAEKMFYSDICNGVSTGGPIEILQCPDSESAFGFLETYVVLFELTKKEHWLEKACAAANYCISWCVSYDFEWPENAEFGRLNMKTTGSVWANVQNKHSAPGICTFSGNALLKLYRYTKNTVYLEQLREIAHNLPQYMSRDERTIYSWDKPPVPLVAGMICERVNMSDWENTENVGGVFNGNTWAEAALLLSCAEIPGIYINTETAEVCVFDHVTAEVTKIDDEKIILSVTNPTNYDATVTIFAESQVQSIQALEADYTNRFLKHEIKSGKTICVTIYKS